MNGWILYSGTEVRELTRACEEAGRFGVQLQVVDPRGIDLVLDPASPGVVFRNGAPVPAPMFAIAGFVEDAGFDNLALLQQLEAQGILCINRAATLRKTRDKLLTLQLLAAHGLPVPKTILLRGNTDPAFVTRQLGLPVVVKPNFGSKGHGVLLVRTEKELANLLELLDASHAREEMIAQEFLADSGGRDVRVLVIDGRPAAGMLRQNRTPDGFKSNFSAGGRVEEFPLTDPIRDLAARVIHLLELNIGGIDLLFHRGGFVVGEANSIPGFQGIESCCQINVPAEILKSIGRQIKELATRTRQKSPPGAANT